MCEVMFKQYHPLYTLNSPLSLTKQQKLNYTLYHTTNLSKQNSYFNGCKAKLNLNFIINFHPKTTTHLLN